MSRSVVREMRAYGVPVSRGEVLVPTQVRDPIHGSIDCLAAPLVAGSLVRRGCRVQFGAVPRCDEAGSDTDPVLYVATCPQQDGSTAAIAAAADPDDKRLLAAANSAVEEWAATSASRTLIAAGSPWCSGALLAASAARKAAAEHAANGRTVHVLGVPAVPPEAAAELASLGAVVTESIADVKSGDMAIFPAQGVPAGVREEAAERGIEVVDATCPLVAAAQLAARQTAERGQHLVLIGQAANACTAGIVSLANGQATVVESPSGVALRVADSRHVSYLLQPGIAVEATTATVAALRSRYPAARNAEPAETCYEPSDRAGSVYAVAVGSDIVLVLGDPQASDTRQVCAQARDAGVKVHVISEPGDITPAMLASASTIGTAESTSALPGLAGQVTTALSGLGKLVVIKRQLRTERVAGLQASWP